jgi:hypothetical protein|eukprot:COSAG02_NODE_749_length_17699_cov_13.252727_5_plen_101_part_00
MANDPALSILSFDLDIGLGRTHRYITNRSLIVHNFGFGLSFHRFSYEALQVELLQDGGLNATVTLSLNDSVLDTSSLAAAGVGEVPSPLNNDLATRSILI